MERKLLQSAADPSNRTAEAMYYHQREYQAVSAREDDARSCFYRYDRSSNGTIETEEIQLIFMDLNFIPVFGKRFASVVQQVLEDTGKADSKRLTFAEFILLYNQMREIQYKEEMRVEHKGKNLEDCCRDGDTDTAKSLILKGAKPDKLDSGGNIHLIMAAVRNFLPLCQLLLKYQADASLLTCERDALMDSVQTGNAFKFKLLVEKLYGRRRYEQAELSARMCHGAMEAAREGHKNLRYGKSSSFGSWKVSSLSRDSRPAGAKQRLTTPLKKKVYHPKELTTALIASVCESQLDEVKKWVELGADVNCKDDSWDTPLIHCIWNGDQELLLYLLEKGAKILHSNIRKNNVFHYCKELGRSDLLSHLQKQKGAEKCMEQQNILGYTPREVELYLRKQMRGK